MPSLNLDLDYFGHPKTNQLIGLLGKGADILPIRLWVYCGKHHSGTGTLTAISTQEIELAVGWWGKKGLAVAAFVECGFLDVIDGGYQVHDWLDHSGHLAAYKLRAQKAAKARWSKNATSTELDATSIACSSATICKDSLDRTNSQRGENAHTARAEFDRSPELLAREWMMRFKGTQASECDPHRLGGFFGAWLDAGGDFDAILAGIRGKRDYGEPTWDFKKRIRGVNGGHGDQVRPASRVSAQPSSFDAIARKTIHADSSVGTEARAPAASGAGTG